MNVLTKDSIIKFKLLLAQSVNRVAETKWSCNCRIWIDGIECPVESQAFKFEIQLNLNFFSTFNSNEFFPRRDRDYKITHIDYETNKFYVKCPYNGSYLISFSLVGNNKQSIIIKSIISSKLLNI